jgi:hypothetical protein
MDRENILNEIYSLILENGVFTEKIDVLEEDNRVYTKKIPVDIMLDGNKIKFVSVSGYNEDLSDTSYNDLRINILNYSGGFLNLFCASVSDEVLYNILTSLKNNA